MGRREDGAGVSKSEITPPLWPVGGASTPARRLRAVLRRLWAPASGGVLGAAGSPYAPMLEASNLIICND